MAITLIMVFVTAATVGFAGIWLASSRVRTWSERPKHQFLDACRLNRRVSRDRP